MIRAILAGSLVVNAITIGALTDVANGVNEPPPDVDASIILSELRSGKYYEVYKTITNSSVSFQRLKEQYLEDCKHFTEAGLHYPCKQTVFHNTISTKEACYAELIIRRRYGTYIKARYIPAMLPKNL